MAKRSKRAATKLKHFLIVFDHDTGDVRVQTFTDTARAIKAYEDEERALGDRPRLEIVLVGSDSLRTVKLTHANYFKGAASTSPYLKDLE